MVNLAHYIHLVRPLAVFDLETTGVSVQQDRIWQISITKHYPDRDPVRWSQLVNPQMEVPRDAVQEDGVDVDDLNRRLKSAPIWATVGPLLAPKIVDVDFGGYNVLNYDLPLIRNEMRRVGVNWDWEANDSKVIDVARIYHIKNPRTLQDCYRRYVNASGFSGAHDANHDVMATEESLAGQLREHDDIPRSSVAELSDFCFPVRPGAVDRQGKMIWRGKDACFSFGRHSGKPLQLVDRKYLEWVLTGDFSAEVKQIVARALSGQFPAKPD